MLQSSGSTFTSSCRRNTKEGCASALVGLSAVGAGWAAGEACAAAGTALGSPIAGAIGGFICGMGAYLLVNFSGNYFIRELSNQVAVQMKVRCESVSSLLKEQEARIGVMVAE